MDKRNAYKLSIFSGLCPDTTNNKEPDPKFEFVESGLKQVLDEIFSVDEVSGFPKGDIQYYLSKNGNPQVKQWLENNLLAPRRSVSSNPEGVTDDLIVEMSRKSDESVSAYQSRLMDIYDSAKAEYERSINPNPE